MKRSFVLFLLIVSAFAGYSQWITQSTGFTTPSRGITDIDAVNSNVLWAIAYDGADPTAPCQEFTRTINGGSTWTPGNVSGIPALSLAMIDAYSEQIAWVVAYPGGSSFTGQGIWKTTDGGNTWVHQTSASFSNSSSFANCVHFFNANEGWCQGDPINGDFEIYTTSNGGSTWTIVPGSQIANPLSGEFGVIQYTCSVGDTSWFGTNKGRIYRSVDKGHNWTAAAIPGWISKYCVPVFRSGTHGLAQDRGLSSTGLLAETSDGGNTWSVITGVSSFTNDINYVPGTPNTYVADGADADNNALGVMYSYDGGHVWTIMPETDGIQYLAGAWVDAQHGWGGSFNSDSYSDGMYKYMGNLASSYLIVSYPNGGEYLQTGSVQNITWSGNGISNVKIEYSTNNGSSWITIVSSYPAGGGSYAWTIPNTPSTTCRVRVLDAVNTSVGDMSDNVFTIGATSQSLTLDSPNGGENWNGGSSYYITWTSSAVNYVNLEYSTDNGNTWMTITSNYPDGPGSYLWTVPGLPSSLCLVRITDSNNPSLTDMSDFVFTITIPSYISVIDPNGGENWFAGSINYITWNGSGMNNVKIEYTTNDGISWITIISSFNASAGAYTWIVPNTPSNLCRVRVSDAGNSSVSDISDYVFTISSNVQTVTVTNPNGGETWQTGSIQNITWASSGVSDVKIEYTTNNGSNWNVIINSFPASVGSYSWAVPNTPSSQCRIRISDYWNSSLSDISNFAFTISTGGQSTPEICIITVDSINNRNMLVWEKPYSVTIDHYNIYKEGNIANLYEQIGTVSYGNVSVFTDMASNPLQQANRYKISIVDIYNIETSLSDEHMTVHLTINQGAGNTFNLMWNNYYGFSYPSVNLYRGDSPNNMSLLATVASSINSFTDLYPPPGYVYYKIEVLKPVPCTPSKTTIGSSVSNIASNDPYLSNQEIAAGTGTIIYPNPTIGKIKIVSPYLIEDIRVFNSVGMQVQEAAGHSGEIFLDLSGNNKGVYFLQLKSADKTEIRKIIVL